MYEPANSFILAKNTLYNILAQVFLTFVSIVFIPILIHKVGEEGFGIILLSWTIIGYFNSLDLGIGRAVSHYVSRFRVLNKKIEIYGLIWSALLISLLWGSFIVINVFIFSKSIANLLFKLSLSSYNEVENVLKLIAFGSIFILIQSVLRANLMSFQRFDYINLIQSIAALLQWFASLILAYLGFGVFTIVSVTVLIRALSTVVFFIFVKAVSRDIFKYIFVSKASIVELIKFGVWIGISQFVSFILIYADRFFISSIISTRMATYFIIPSEITTRILFLIPGSLTLTLFPALTERILIDINQAYILYMRSLRYIYVLMYPLTLTLFFVAPEVLELWLGKDFAAHSSLVFKVLLIGLFINSISQIPLTMIQSMGRPDIITKLQVFEFIIYVPLCILLVYKFGINGAAFANLIRISIEASFAFTYIAISFKNFKLKTPLLEITKEIYLSFFWFILYTIVSHLKFKINIILFVYLVLTTAFWVVVYILIFDGEDKKMVLKIRDVILNYIYKAKNIPL